MLKKGVEDLGQEFYRKVMMYQMGNSNFELGTQSYSTDWLAIHKGSISNPKLLIKKKKNN